MNEEEEEEEEEEVVMRTAVSWLVQQQQQQPQQPQQPQPQQLQQEHVEAGNSKDDKLRSVNGRGDLGYALLTISPLMILLVAERGTEWRTITVSRANGGTAKVYAAGHRNDVLRMKLIPRREAQREEEEEVLLVVLPQQHPEILRALVRWQHAAALPSSCLPTEHIFEEVLCGDGSSVQFFHDHFVIATPLGKGQHFEYSDIVHCQRVSAAREVWVSLSDGVIRKIRVPQGMARVIAHFRLRTYAAFSGGASAPASSHAGQRDVANSTKRVKILERISLATEQLEGKILRIVIGFHVLSRCARSAETNPKAARGSRRFAPRAG